ncbi:MAG: bifunctional DNA primase/polymerase [Proteobacteria bacterium]|nr:bifunctional DNA primase/polymerase [Pseudomonadota bacterium]
MSTISKTKIIRSQAEREENRRLFRVLQEKGLSPRVVTDGTKACHSHNWQVPDAQQATATLDAWAHQAGDAGIALLLGAPISDGTHLGVIDVDNDAYTRAVACLLGNPAVVKIGRKGASFFVRVAGTPGGSFTRNPEFRNRAIVNGIETDKVKVVECLFDGKISVLPPSIHPDTGKPYAWTGPTIEDADLLQLPAVWFDHDGPGLSLHLLKAVVTNKHFMQLASGVSTHDAARDFSAALVAFEPSDARIEEIVKAVLPEGYSGNTLVELPGLIRGAREKGLDKLIGGSGKKRKKSQADEAVELVLASGVRFFHWKKIGAFIELPTAEGASINYKLQSEEAEDYIRDLYFGAYEGGVSDRAMKDALATIRGHARSKGLAIKPTLRVGGDETRVFHDLGRADGLIIEIDRDGYRLTKAPSVRLIRAAGMRELPLPAPGPEANSGLVKFFNLIGVAEENRPLLAGFIISTLHPTGPYCVLAVDGDAGAGKSVLCEFIKGIVDPHDVMRLSVASFTTLVTEALIERHSR